MDEPEIITLRLTRKSRFWFLVFAVLLVLMGGYGAATYQNTGSAASTETAISLCAVFVCAVLLWRRSRRGEGELRVDTTGIVIDTPNHLGRVTWDNLEKIALCKKFRQPYLGFAVKSGQAFLDTKNGLAGGHSLDMTLIKYGNLAGSLYPPKGMDIGYRLIGLTPYPSSGKEADILAWNRENYGYDLPLAIIGVAAAADIPARIEKHRPAVIVPASVTVAAPFAAAASATLAPEAAAEFKICPECAEQVRAAAKICRFCHYNFETGAMPA